MMIFAKGINSGYVPLGATMFNGRIRGAFEGHRDAGFMHGNTYLAHPLACAAALANLEIVVKDGLMRADEGMLGVGNRAHRISPIVEQMSFRRERWFSGSALFPSRASCRTYIRD